jgi:hypothetical protein
VSGLSDSRTALGAALVAAGLRVSYDPGRVNVPGVLVAPAEPWVQPSHLVTRSAQVRWRVIAVGGKADATVTLEEVEDLVAAIVLAVPREYGTPTFDAPGTVDLGGAQYLAAVGRVDHLTEV